MTPRKKVTNDEPLTIGDFKRWELNDFHSLSNIVHSLTEEVAKLARSLSFVKGQLVVMIPLSIAILGMVIFLALK